MRRGKGTGCGVQGHACLLLRAWPAGPGVGDTGRVCRACREGRPGTPRGCPPPPRSSTGRLYARPILWNLNPYFQTSVRKDQNMRIPAGLQKPGRSLWRKITAEFDLENEPDKLELLYQAAKTADQIAELDEAAAEAPLTVKGSMGQPVISPFIAEARVQARPVGPAPGAYGVRGRHR